MVIEEAASLGVPVLTVATTSSEEMVVRQGRGWVCANEQNMLNEILEQVLSDPGTLQITMTHLRRSVMDNTIAIEQFMKMIEG